MAASGRRPSEEAAGAGGRRARQAFKARRFEAALEPLQRLARLSARVNLEIQHNLLLAQYYASSTADPVKMLDSLEKLKKKLEERAAGEDAPYLAELSTGAAELQPGAARHRAEAVRHGAGPARAPLPQHRAAGRVPEPQDLLPAGRAVRHHAAAGQASQVVAYVEKTFLRPYQPPEPAPSPAGPLLPPRPPRRSAVAAGPAGQGQGQGGAEAALAASLMDGAGAGGLGPGGAGAGAGVARAGCSGARRPAGPSPCISAPAELKISLHLYRARAHLLTKAAKACKREIKQAMGAAVAASPHMATCIFLKAHLEYQGGNLRKALKLLNALHQAAPAAGPSVAALSSDRSLPVLYYADMGCIHYRMRKFRAAAFYFLRALRENVAAFPSSGAGAWRAGRWARGARSSCTTWASRCCSCARASWPSPAWRRPRPRCPARPASTCASPRPPCSPTPPPAPAPPTTPSASSCCRRWAARAACCSCRPAWTTPRPPTAPPRPRPCPRSTRPCARSPPCCWPAPRRPARRCRAPSSWLSRRRCGRRRWPTSPTATSASATPPPPSRPRPPCSPCSSLPSFQKCVHQPAAWLRPRCPWG